MKNFFEKTNNVICIPFYPDEHKSLNMIANNFFKKKGIKISQQTINLIIDRANQSRQHLNNELKKIENIYKITVNFVSEIITCVRDKNNKIVEGNPDSIKTVNDVWEFSKNMWSQDPTWYLVGTAKN